MAGGMSSSSAPPLTIKVLPAAPLLGWVQVLVGDVRRPQASADDKDAGRREQAEYAGRRSQRTPAESRSLPSALVIDWFSS
jgi:hypothetical protein